MPLDLLIPFVVPFPDPCNYSFITQVLHIQSFPPTPHKYPLHLLLKLLNLEEKNPTAVRRWPLHELHLIMNIEMSIIPVNILTRPCWVLMLMNGKDEAFLLFSAVLNQVKDTLLLGSGAGEPPRDDSRLFVVGKRFSFLFSFFPSRAENFS